MRKVDVVCDVCGYIHKVDAAKLETKGTDWEYLCIPKPQYCDWCKCLTRHKLLKDFIKEVHRRDVWRRRAKKFKRHVKVQFD